jgi:SAM-dependent methyltransferase
LGLREELSFKYLRGEGIEIGALASPIKVAEQVKVTYVDTLPRQKLAAQYPDAPIGQIIEPQVICDATTLDKIKDSSVDFVIASHLLEHMADPFKSLDNWIRALKPKGILYLIVPDMLRTFDVDRPLTSVNHLVEDYVPNSTKRDPRMDFVHFLEWVTFVHHKLDKASEAIPRTKLYMRASQLQQLATQSHGSIHYHTFVKETLLEVLHLTEQRCKAKILEFRDNESSNEFIAILQKL